MSMNKIKHINDPRVLVNVRKSFTDWLDSEFPGLNTRTKQLLKLKEEYQNRR